MKRTIYDTPLNQGRPAKVVLGYGGAKKKPKKKPKRRTLVVIAKEHGVHPHSISYFRTRHPELAHWSADEVAAQVAANKDQSEVARRQQHGKRKGWRNVFGSIDYEEAPQG